MLAGIADWLLDPSSLTAHGFCLLWDPWLIWVHALSDIGVGIAYFSIPVAVTIYARRRRDLVFRPVLWLFATFILLCGSGHWLDLLTIWVPVYRLEGAVKAATAVVSLVTALALWWLMPRALTLPSPLQMRQANQRLRESEAQLLCVTKSVVQLRALVDASPTALILTSAGGRIHMVNAMAERVFGYSREDVQDEPLHRLLPCGLGEAGMVPCGRDGARSLQIPPDGRDLLGVRKDGTCFPVEICVSAIEVDGKPMRLAGITDITARRDGERATQQQHALERSNAELIRARLRAEQATRAKSRFLASMSHELRTPLNGILGCAELLGREGQLNASQTARVAAMRGAGQHLLQMINGVLDLSEIEAGHIALQPVAVDIRALAGDCLDSLRPCGESKDLRIALRLCGAIPDRMLLDPVRLRQILLNLIGNAMKFTAQGGVEVCLRVAASSDQAQSLLIDIIDTGCGIPPDRRADLFRDFERLGATTGGNTEGAGLGLAISARLAALMGGRILHEDNRPCGSIFTLEVPMAATASGHLPVTDSPATPRTPVSTGMRPGVMSALDILVVDDIRMNLDITTALLRAEGHRVTAADGGAAAVTAVAGADFDVVLMDLRMPDVDGFEAVRRIRTLDGPRGRVPVIALTAEAFSEQIDECRRSGMVGHLAKPFTLASLLDAVAKGVADARAALDAPPGAQPSDRSSLPLLDLDTFRTNCALLPPVDVDTHLGHIAVSIEALLQALHAPDTVALVGGDLVDSVHTLAGSAGMFGFQRLTEAARRFVQAARLNAPERPLVAADLRTALEASLGEMQRCGRIHEAAAA